jgi:hypothetical protein
MEKKSLGFNVAQKYDYENGFYLTSKINRIGKIVAHYELYKSIVNLPGHIVECGVYKGASLIRFTSFREILENAYSRKVIGFDIFGKFPQNDERDQGFIEKFEKAGGNGISIDELEAVFAYKSFNNYELVKGNISETVPNYLKDNPELKIALLHIDVDVYQPSMVVLEHFYDRVVRGGLIVFDDFGTVAGETKAIDEFFKKQDVIIEKLSVSPTPAYIRKK